MAKMIEKGTKLYEVYNKKDTKYPDVLTCVTWVEEIKDGKAKPRDSEAFIPLEYFDSGIGYRNRYYYTDEESANKKSNELS